MNAVSDLEIQPVSGPVTGNVRPPGSKSLTNRAVLIATLAKGTSRLDGVLDSVDTRVMVDCLDRMGIGVAAEFEHNLIRITGSHETAFSRAAELWCENSGTSIRFLTALCAVMQGTFRLDGNQRMRERPIGPLVETLVSAGVDAHCEFGNGCPPVTLHSHGLPGGHLSVSGEVSSQYLSGLLMVAPAAQSDMELQVCGELVSRPYIDMTLAVMRSFGAEIDEPTPNRFQVRRKPYTAIEYQIEPDASAASYFLAAAAITGGRVTVRGLHRDALQGDIRFVDALVRMGCRADWEANSVTVQGGQLDGIDIDMNSISDTAQTLACVAPFAKGPTRIRNVAHNRVKETDRITAVVTELRRVGLQVDEHPDGMTIFPGPIRPATIQTYDDHRMAMSFALLGLKVSGIRIANPDCTSKTYPGYFNDLAQLCGTSS